MLHFNKATIASAARETFFGGAAFPVQLKAKEKRGDEFVHEMDDNAYLEKHLSKLSIKRAAVVDVEISNEEGIVVTRWMYLAGPRR